jgi:L-iditol 2-dehydrogenase
VKALVKTGPKEDDLELKNWPEPSPGPEQVKLRIAAAGICGTDIHIIKGRWPCRPPVVLGHEFCGTVVEIGARVKNLKPGDRVVSSNPAETCGNCYHCRAGNPFMCSERVSAGYMIDGAFADYLCIAAERCHLLPENVSFRQAALGEPLAVAVRAVIERNTVHAGDLVLVSGPGCVGLLTTQIAKLEGGAVIVAGIAKDARRLALARDLGADLIVETPRQELLEIVRGQRPEGADLVFECAGAADSLNLCLEAVRKEGTVVQVGVYPGPIRTDLNKVMMKELRFIGTYGYVWTTWQRSLRLLAEGRVRTEDLISHEYPLSEFQEAFRVTQDGTAAKVVFTPDATAQ